MIYVTSLDKTREEPLINISDDFRMEQTTDGTLSVSFTVYNSEKNLGYELLGPECIINIYGYEFKVTNHRETTNYKKISGNSTFFNLSKHRKDTMLGGTTTLRDRINFVLEDTGWTATFEDGIANNYVFIENFGNDYVTKLLSIAVERYQVEYVITSDKTIHFTNNKGVDTDIQFRYKRNVGDVALVEDSTNLFTQIKGTGANGIEAVYTSPNHTVYGILEAEPVTNEEFTTTEELLNWLKTQIEDVPKIAIESTIPELVNRNTGDKVWFIYEPLDILMETRILQNTRILKDNKLVTSKVVFGNIIPKTLTDLYVQQIVKIDENDKKNRSLFIQTNEYIRMEVERIGESISTLEITADQIQSSVESLDSDIRSMITQTASDIRTEINALDVKYDGEIATVTSNYQSMINQTANSIRLEVNGLITEVNDDISETNRMISVIQQSVTGISSTVSNLSTQTSALGTRMSNAESNISQTATEISQKVSWTDYNGEEIISMVNQTAEWYKIKAKNIELEGAVSIVDDNLYMMGNVNNRGIYFDRYGNEGQITVNSSLQSMTLDTTHMTLKGVSINLSAANTAIGYVGSGTENMWLAYSSSAKRIYVRIGGVGDHNNIGYIPVTPI